MKRSPELVGEEGTNERYRLKNSVLESREVEEIIQESDDPLATLEKIGLKDLRKRSGESNDPVWADAGNTILAGTLFLKLCFRQEGPLGLKHALEDGKDLVQIQESIQAVKENNLVGWERPSQVQVTPHIARITAGELYKEARELLMPELRAFVEREIEHLR